MRNLARVMTGLLVGAIALVALSAHAPLAMPPAAAVATRFETVDVIIDSGSTPLAAWQVEIVGNVKGGKVSLVGIEGGEHAAYAKPAHYDPEALKGDRVILAAFSTAKPEELPTGKSLVARLHVEVGGDETNRPAYTVTLRVAANAEGSSVDGATATTAALQGAD